MLRGVQASLGPASARLNSSVANSLLQPAFVNAIAGLPLILQPFTNLRAFASAAASTQHLRDFAIIGERTYMCTGAQPKLFYQSCHMP